MGVDTGYACGGQDVATLLYGEQLLGLQESGSKAVCKVWLTLLHVL